MEITETEPIEIDFALKEIKLRVACLVNEKLKEIFPEVYEPDSIVEIFIDICSDPMEIIATANNGLDTEGKIGKIKLNLIETESGYVATPIIMIWAKPLKKPLISLL